ncbi:MAG: DUF4198 domain-containing protein [Gammaproteobacteria bacterium]
MIRVPCRTLLLTACFAFAAAAQGHELWFEPDGKGMVLFYGDFGVNMHERSPGGNDRWGQLTAIRVTPAGDQPVELTKQHDRFTGVPRLAKGESLVAYDEYYRIFEEKQGDKTVRLRWTPATRFVPDLGARPQKLKLDIVPTGKADGDEVELQVFYQSEPLADVPVHLWSTAGWRMERQTDAEGKVRFPLPWRGQYAAIVLRYRDETPGVRNSAVDPNNPLIAHPSATSQETYDAWSHTTLLSFEKRTGLPPLARHPVTLPASMLMGGKPSK